MTITVEAMQRLDEDLDRKVEAGQFAEGRGMKNAYTCGSCGKSMIVVLRNPGTTPMWKNCEAPLCGGEATSRMYRIPQDAPPFYEWYRPMTEAEIEEALSEAGEHREEYARELERGLLAFRRIPGERLPQETREYLRNGRS